MEFKEKTPRSSWKSILSFLKNFNNFFHIFLGFLHKMCDKNHRQTNQTVRGSVMSHALFHFIH